MPAQAPEKSRSLFGPSKVMFKIELPEALYLQYEEEGARNTRSAEEEITKRLNGCKEHTANRPVYFNDKQRKELESLLGRHLGGDPEVLLARLRNAMKLKVGDVEIVLDSHLLDRLSTRVFRGQTIEDNIEKWVIEALEKHAGMRPW